MKRILVTGANGQLGQEIRKLGTNNPSFDFVFTDVDELDITREEEIGRFLDEAGPDIVINCAAYNAVDRAEEEPEKAFSINARAVECLAKATAGRSTQFIHISTDFVFDGSGKSPYKPGDRANPLSVYGRSKLRGEEHAMKEGNGVVIRTSWLYSAFGSNFVKTIIRLGLERDEISVINDQVGSPTYAADLAAMVLEVAARPVDGSGPVSGLFHYSNDGECSWYDFASEIIRLAGINCRVLPVPSASYPQKAGRPKYSVLDKAKTREEFGIRIPGWKDSLQRCMSELNRLE